MRIYKKRYREFKNVGQINARIELLIKVLRKLYMIKPRDSSVERNIRNIRESLSALRITRREWRKYYISVKLFIV